MVFALTGPAGDSDKCSHFSFMGLEEFLKKVLTATEMHTVISSVQFSHSVVSNSNEGFPLSGSFWNVGSF